MTSTQFVYAYPVVLTFGNISQNEVFVTFHEPNFFENPWDSLVMRITATTFWLIALCGSIIIFAYVYYETQGYAASFRTVINQLVTWCYFYIAVFQTIAGVMNLIRAWIGPLPAFICYLNLLLKGGIANGFLFLMLGIFVMKYLFICKWKRLRPIDDDFVARITVLCAVFWGFGLQFSKLIGPGRYPNNFVICTGTFGPAEDALEKHFQLEAPFTYIAFFTCIVLGFKVESDKYYHGKIDFLQRQELRNQNIPNQESILANLGIILVYLTNLTFIIKMNNSEPHRMGEWPYNFYVLANHFGFPLLFVTVPSLAILYKNWEAIGKVLGQSCVLLNVFKKPRPNLEIIPMQTISAQV